MKHVQLFEQFVNEAKVNKLEFTDMLIETRAMIEEKYNFEKNLSQQNLLYILVHAWNIIAEKNKLDKAVGLLHLAFEKFNIKTDPYFMKVELDKQGFNFGRHARHETGYNLQGMVDCFSYAMEDMPLLKPAEVKKIKKFLLK